MAKIKYYSHITETTTGSTMSAYLKKKKIKMKTENLELRNHEAKFWINPPHQMKKIRVEGG